MSNEIPVDSGQDTLHGHGQENASGFTQPKSDQEHRILTRLAKRKEWIIPDRIFKSGPEVLAVIAEDETVDPKERNSVLRTLVMMGNANTGQTSVDVRVNQQIAIEVAPVTPENVNIDVQPAFIEVVNTDQLESTVSTMEEYGFLGHYYNQVKDSDPPLPSNGDGHAAKRS